MVNKTIRLLILVALLVGCAGLYTTSAGKKNNEVEINRAQVQAAVDRALDYMATKTDNTWQTGYAIPGKVVIAAVCGLSFMADGSTPTQGKYSGPIKNAFSFVVRNINEPGMPVQPGGPNNNQTNWSLGIGGIFMAEMCQFDESGELKKGLKQVCDAIAQNQEATGGWGHGPGGLNSLGYIELNVVANYCLAAMGMARQLGVETDNNKIDAAVKYIINCSPGGGVAYSHRADQRGFGCPGRTGGCIFAFDMLEEKGNPFFKQMTGFVKATMPFLLERPGYGHASASLGMFQCGLGALHSGDEKVWNEFEQLYFPKILAAQNPDGSFNVITNKNEPNSDQVMGPLYPTALYALTLQLAQARLRFVGTCYKPCDEKNTHPACRCPACNKILFGYYCQECKKMFPSDAIKGSKKCPVCSKEIYPVPLLTNDNKCFFCGAPVDKSKNGITVCLKEIYACPAHSGEQHLKPGKCQIKVDNPDPKSKEIKRCGQALELVGLNVCEKATIYVCPKCHSINKSPGACHNCKTPLVKEQHCEKSGSFPHINTNDWEEFLKKNSK